MPKIRKSKKASMDFLTTAPQKAIEGMTVFNTNVVDTKKQPMFFR